MSLGIPNGSRRPPREILRAMGEPVARRTKVSGPAVRPLTSNKVARNKACPCGSGQKFKRCCWGQAWVDLESE